jgi:Dolichyl-phosphate-mannose-protein mannosyltransferase
MRVLDNPRTAFNAVLLATLVIKLVLAYVVPMSGDEAYFIVWARHPDYGYYDHPPMVAWTLQLLLYLGSSEVLLRLPAILLSTLIGIGIYRLIRPHDETKAALVAMMFLLAPLNLLNVLITNDTLLILFSFLSGMALIKALQKNGMGWYALAGVFLGMAFLSKYFAALQVLAYLAYFAFSGRDREKLKGALLLFAAAAPFALLNFYWNYTHCWDNILFNLYTRNENEHFSPGKVATFIGMQVYLATPPVLYYLFRHRAGFWQKVEQGRFKVFAYAFLLPIAFLGLLSFKRDIGLHWMLAFYPFLYLLLPLLLSRDELAKSLRFMAWFGGAHLAVVAVIAAMPMETWKNNHLYDGIVFMFKNDDIVAKIRPFEQQGFLLAADGYTPAAILSYHYGKNFFVFGTGSYYARQDDMITDFRQFRGRNMLIVRKSAPAMPQYAPYFRKVEVRQFELRGATFYMVLGYDFNYDAYRNNVLRAIMDQYYRIPSFLPHAPCYFCEKYFPGEHC